MTKLNKPFAVLLITVLLFCIFPSTSYASTDNNSNLNSFKEYSLEEARELAIMHIKSIMTSDDCGMWNNKIKIINETPIFDSNDIITGYYFKLETIEHQPAGYVITGANSYQYPIIEYSTKGQSFIEKYFKTICSINGYNAANYSAKIYYMNNLTYIYKFYNGKSCHIFEISNDYNEIQTLKPEHEFHNFSAIWSKYIDLSESSKNDLPPDEENVYITSPPNYESGYSLSRYYTLPAFNRNYKTTSMFSQSDNCAPTAAVNLCYYWYSRNPEKYASLKQDPRWTNVHDDFYNLMNTHDGSGTSDFSIASAYEDYFNQVGLSCKATLHFTTDFGQKIVDELDNSRPVHLILHDNRTYSEHSVLALGYYQFEYNGSGNSTYIRIADGFSESPNRYVWGGCAGYWNYVTVIPK